MSLSKEIESLKDPILRPYAIRGYGWRIALIPLVAILLPIWLLEHIVKAQAYAVHGLGLFFSRPVYYVNRRLLELYERAFDAKFESDPTFIYKKDADDA